MDLQLRLPLPLPNSIKRMRATQDHGDTTPKTLPLLSWNDQPNDEDNRKKQPKTTDSCPIQKEEEEKNNLVVGWPPIKSWRKKAFHRPQMMANRRRRDEIGGRNSWFVKVKMEGVALTRKLDLRLYHSHHSLKSALTSMFSPYERLEKDGWDLVVVYEDEEGDWLLAGDLPWNSFVESVQRLKILVQKRSVDGTKN